MTNVQGSVGVGFGPFGVSVPIGSSDTGGREAYMQEWTRIQNQKDRAFQQKQFAYAVDQNWVNKRREDTRIQRLAADARKAGISPLAALGGGGSMPASINIPSYTPSPQGRVGGTYKRALNFQAQLQLDKFLTDNSQQQEFNKWRNHEQMYRALSAEDEWTKSRYRTSMGWEPHYNLYVPVYDNSDFLKEKYPGMRYAPNPDINFEMPEHVGGYYWYRENTFPNEGYNNDPSFNNWLLGAP